MGCTFCASTLSGLARNLSASYLGRDTHTVAVVVLHPHTFYVITIWQFKEIFGSIFLNLATKKPLLSINPSENQENVAWLAEHFDLETESLNPYLPEKLQNKMTEQGMLQMLPGVMESDGFFVARLRKRG